MNTSVQPRVREAFKRELSDWRRWASRAVVLAAAAAAGWVVVAFTWLSEQAMHGFGRLLQASGGWGALLWTPLLTVAIVWATRRFAPGAAGSGIPQVMAALEPVVEASQRRLYVSLRLTLAKIGLTSAGLLAGLSLGREGPSVQIAAGIMHHARRWLPANSGVSPHGLLMAGGAAGIAAAFNTPLGGVMFAIEELSRRPEQRSSGLLLAAIVLAGLMSVSVHGNVSYFGVIRVESLTPSLALPGLMVALAAGALGGLFARLLLMSLTPGGPDRFSRLRQAHPLRFAAGCGLAVAVIGLASGGATWGSGYEATRALLEGGGDRAPFYTGLKFVATWLTTWAGVPAGIFAPSLAIGAGLGKDVADLFGLAQSPTLIALGMAGFLAAVTQAPLTAFIIVMEMVDGHALVLSLMASALVSSAVSRLISAPLYASLAQLQLQRLPSAPASPSGASRAY
ncbi:MAG: hypothetical protein Fur0019_00690 [Tibeticola sp.]